MPNDDTIAAISTAPGRAAVGIVRVSGPLAASIAERLTQKVLQPRVATLCAFRDVDGRDIDSGLALFFRAPQSYTGEHMLEVQAHGNPVLLASLLRRCVELGARVAEPGEFTRRAFLNDKLDLAQAEAVADVIAANSQAAIRAANRALTGVFSAEIHALVSDLVDTRVILEAGLDFPEEELDVLTEYGIRQKILVLKQRLESLVVRARKGKLLSEGVRVALIGAPNSGKSSVLNRIAEEEVAIVTDIPGTTRDTLTINAEISGIPFTFVDTAGVRDTGDVVEQLGVARSLAAGEGADIVLLVVDPAQEIAQTTNILDRLSRLENVVVAFNKCDLSVGIAAGQHERLNKYPNQSISAKTGDGFDALMRLLLHVCGWENNEQSETVFVAHARQISAITEAADRVRASLDIQDANPELIAEELRYASEALGKITGTVTSDDLLGQIFSKFCIGK